jgi:hypothetical protein
MKKGQNKGYEKEYFMPTGSNKTSIFILQQSKSDLAKAKRIKQKSKKK